MFCNEKTVSNSKYRDIEDRLLHSFSLFIKYGIRYWGNSTTIQKVFLIQKR
jgi:hypothetical protein